MRRIAIAGALLISATACHDKTRPTAEDIADAHEAITLKLRDPASAQYRYETVLEAGADRVICGEVNAKNAAGGYDGFMPYLYSVGTGKAELLVNTFAADREAMKSGCIEHAADVLN